MENQLGSSTSDAWLDMRIKIYYEENKKVSFGAPGYNYSARPVST